MVIVSKEEIASLSPPKSASEIVMMNPDSSFMFLSGRNLLFH